MDKEKMIKVENLVDYGDIKKGTICNSKSSDYNFFNQEGKEVRSFGITEDIESFFDLLGHKQQTEIRAIDLFGFVGQVVLNPEIFKEIESVVQDNGLIVYNGTKKKYKIYHITSKAPNLFSKLYPLSNYESEKSATITGLSIFSDKIVCLLDNKKHITIAEGENPKEVLNKNKPIFEKLIGQKIDFGRVEFIPTKADKNEIKNFFVHSKEEFVKKIEELNGRYNLYAGLNERKLNGTKAEEVASVKRIFIDIDCKNKPANLGDLKEADKVAEKIIEDLETKFKARPSLIDSGNGRQLVYCIPEIQLNKENFKGIEEKIQTFQRELIKEYSNDTIQLDNVGDLPRIIRVTGAINIKGGRHSSFIENKSKESEKLKEYILNLSLVESSNNIKIKTEGKEIDTSLKEILDKDERVKKLFEGDIKGFKSRSEAEMSLVCHLIGLNLNKEQIFKVMSSSKIGKWEEQNLQYRDLTYSKALEKVTKEKREKGTKTIKSSEFLGIENFNRETEIYAPKDCLIYQKEEKGIQADSYFFEVEYNLYKVNIGSGNKPKFIFCNATDKIERGESSVYLIPLELKEVQKIVKDLRGAGILTSFVEKQARIKVEVEDKEKATLDDYELALLRKQESSLPIFFKKTLPIPIKELKKIEDYYSFVKKILTQEVEIDENLIDTYVSLIPEVNPLKIKPKTFMNSANHQMIITNAGVGKTSLAVAITREPTISDCSSANLIGFSTADRKISGRLDGRVKPTIIEEIQEFKEQEVLGQTLTYLEQGETERAKGQGIKCRGHSQIVFQGNPKFKTEEDFGLSKFLMARAIKDFISKVSSNTEALGRRIGDLEIGQDYKAVKGRGINEDKLNKTSQIIRTIAEGFSSQFTDLLLKEEVFEWLNNPHNEEYLEQIDKIIKECNDQMISDFFRGQKINYRHLRGGALRRAWLQVGLSKVIIKEKLEKEDIKDILDCADTHLENRKARNIRSMANILNLVGSPEYNKILEKDIRDLRPEYFKLLICSFFRHMLGDIKERVIHINEIEEDFVCLRDSWKVEGKYTSFSRIKEPFEKHLSQLKTIMSNFGLDYDISLSSFIIKDLDLFKRKLDLYKNIIGTNGTEGTEGTTGTEGTEGTTGTEGTEGTESTEKCTSLCVAVPNVPLTLGLKREKNPKNQGFFEDSEELNVVTEKVK